MSEKKQWQTYRMWRRPVHAVANAGSSAAWLGDWQPTRFTFRGRSTQEAQRKADKLWRECQFGAGSMMVFPADQDLRIALAEETA